MAGLARPDLKYQLQSRQQPCILWWAHQVIMPGYGQPGHRKTPSEFAMEKIPSINDFPVTWA